MLNTLIRLFHQSSGGTAWAGESGWMGHREKEGFVVDYEGQAETGNMKVKTWKDCKSRDSPYEKQSWSYFLNVTCLCAERWSGSRREHCWDNFIHLDGDEGVSKALQERPDLFDKMFTLFSLICFILEYSDNII